MGRYFVTRPVILQTKEGFTTTCREHFAMREDPTAEAKCVLGDDTILGPIHDKTLDYTMYDTAVRCRSLVLNEDGTNSWAVISRGVGRYVTEISTRCKHSMLGSDMAFAIRSKANTPLGRNAELSSPLMKLSPLHLIGKVKSSVQDQGI